jgi:hypothetical protein
VEAGAADPRILDDYELACRPAAQTNANKSLGNMMRLGEISKVLRPCADLAALEARLASLSEEESSQLVQAIERQRSHFLSHGRLPEDPAAEDRTPG